MNKLDGIDPLLVEKVNRVLAGMAAIGYPMKVCQGFRTVAEQQALFASGRTKPGKIVTNCDGVRLKSNHQSGKAVDCCFVTDPFGETQPWRAYGELAKALGLKWGGDWAGSLVDRPHVELK